MRDVDYDAVDRIYDELMELKLQLKASQAAKVSKGRDYTDDGEASKREKIHPAVVKFTKENEWFSGDNYDPEMKAYAIMLDNTLQGDPKWMARSIDERLAEVKTRVEKRFDYNKNPKRTGASAVDGGDLGRGGKMKVDLSATELELARGLGIPDDVFAKQKQFTKKMKGGRYMATKPWDVPREAAGDIIWEGEARADTAFSGLAPVCYSCHDDTVAGGSYVFDESAVQHPLDREAGTDCNMCHDPHISDYGSFLLFPSGANLCQASHEHADEADHPVNRSVREVGFTPADTHRDPDHGDLKGARLWDVSGRPGTEYTKCLTCHAAHAGSAESMLATDIHDGTDAASGFCQTVG